MHGSARLGMMWCGMYSMDCGYRHPTFCEKVRCWLSMRLMHGSTHLGRALRCISCIGYRCRPYNAARSNAGLLAVLARCVVGLAVLRLV